MPVDFTLYHSSRGQQNLELGHKFSHSFNIYLYRTGGVYTVHWGNDLAYDFTPDGMGGYVAPTGIHDVLVNTGGSNFKLTTKN